MDPRDQTIPMTRRNQKETSLSVSDLFLWHSSMLNAPKSRTLETDPLLLSTMLAEYIDHSKHDPEKVVEVSPDGRYAKVKKKDRRRKGWRCLFFLQQLQKKNG